MQSYSKLRNHVLVSGPGKFPRVTQLSIGKWGIPRLGCRPIFPGVDPETRDRLTAMLPGVTMRETFRTQCVLCALCSCRDCVFQKRVGRSRTLTIKKSYFFSSHESTDHAYKAVAEQEEHRWIAYLLTILKHVQRFGHDLYRLCNPALNMCFWCTVRVIVGKKTARLCWFPL